MRDSEDKIQFITDDLANIPDLEPGEPFMVEGGNELYVGNGTENIKISGSGNDITVNLVAPDAANNIQLNHEHVGALPVVNPVAQGSVSAPAFISSPWRPAAFAGDKNGVAYFLYDHGGENWAGMGVRVDGMAWIRSGTSNANASTVWFPAGTDNRYAIWVNGVPLSHIYFSAHGGTIHGNVHVLGWMHVNGAVATDSTIVAGGQITSHSEIHAGGRMFAGGGMVPSAAHLLGPDAWTIHPWVDGVHPDLHYRHPHWGAGTVHTFPLAIRARPAVHYIGHARVSINQFSEVIFQISVNAHLSHWQHVTTVPAGFRPVIGEALMSGHSWTGNWHDPATFRVNADGTVQFLGASGSLSSWASGTYVAH